MVVGGGGPDAQAPPQSPCVGLCQLDVQRVCLGCGRHIDEIVEWGFSDDARKHEILHAAHRRITLIRTGKPPEDESQPGTR